MINGAKAVHGPESLPCRTNTHFHRTRSAFSSPFNKRCEQKENDGGKGTSGKSWGGHNGLGVS